MARRSGRNGRIYIDKDAAFSGSAEPITTVQTWSISSTRDKIETTCLCDTSKQYIMVLCDASGGFAGLDDIGTVNGSPSRY